jgi:hypothetical protein
MVFNRQVRSTKDQAVAGADRDSASFAESVMRQACPEARGRRFLMARMLESIALAEKVGPRSWAVTLFDNGFRLNVGQVEAFVYRNRLARFLMLGAAPAQALTVGDIVSCSYRSMPQPQFAFYGSAQELERIHHHLAPLHAAFVQTAAVTSKGKPRRCPYSRYHSIGLHNYAVQAAGASQIERPGTRNQT